MVGKYFQLRPDFLDLPECLDRLPLSAVKSLEPGEFTYSTFGEEYLLMLFTKSDPAGLEVLLQWLDMEHDPDPEESQKSGRLFLARRLIKQCKLLDELPKEEIVRLVNMYPLGSNVIEIQQVFTALEGPFQTSSREQPLFSELARPFASAGFSKLS